MDFFQEGFARRLLGYVSKLEGQAASQILPEVFFGVEAGRT